MKFLLPFLWGWWLFLSAAATAEPIRAGYFPFWATYSHSYHINDVPAERLTHLIYAYANISPAGEVILGDKYADVDRIYPDDSAIGGRRGNFNQLRKLQLRHPHLQSVIAIGGWSYSENFAIAAEQPEKFAQSVADFVKQYGFNGVELDWRAPVMKYRGQPAQPQQREQYFELIKATRTALTQLSQVSGQTYSLSVTLSADAQMMPNWPLPEMQHYVDFISLLSIDFHGRWNQTTGHYVPLYAPAGELSVSSAVTRYFALGGQNDKLVLILASQGTAWQGVKQAGVGQATVGVPLGTWDNDQTGPTGVFSQQDIQGFKDDPSWQQGWDKDAKAAWLFHPQQQIWLSYDSSEGIGAKLDYANSQQLAGTALWTLSGDAIGNASVLRQIHQFDNYGYSLWLDVKPWLLWIIVAIGGLGLLALIANQFKRRRHALAPISLPDLVSMLEQAGAGNQDIPEPIQQLVAKLQVWQQQALAVESNQQESTFNVANIESKRDILPVWQQSRSVEGLHQELVSWFSRHPGVKSAAVYQGERQIAASETQEQSENDQSIQLLLNDLDACVLQLEVSPEHSNEAHFRHLTDQLGQCRQYLMQLCRQPQLLSELHTIAQAKEKLRYIKAERGYSGLYLDGQAEPSYILMRLTGIKLYFDNQTLLQVHRSWLVNPSRVVGLEKMVKAKWQLRLDTGEVVPVSKSYVQWIQQHFPHWWQQRA
ncbi:glycosyl hydrolase family 18 protein [Motilimonas sp. KMU-193]|uniref:glycosyl hydrolase family 18 protein n=1 Tax=Motilimonas sp. KMU-193 TaxID=3388668 RepID=UPI00396AFB35